MADYTKIQLKRTGVKGRVPALADLEYGEIAINYADGKFFMKTEDSDGLGTISSRVVEVQNFTDPVSFDDDVTLGSGSGNQHIINGLLNLLNGMDAQGLSVFEKVRVDSELYVYNKLIVNGQATVDQVTIDSDTITTTSGDLNISSASGNINSNGDWEFHGNVVITGALSAASQTLPDGSVVLGQSTSGAYVKSLTAGTNISLSQSAADSEENVVVINAQFPRILPDNYDLAFGTDSDLLIYHDGTNSVIKNNTGNLTINMNGFIIENDGSANKLFFKNSGGTSLMSLDDSGNLIVAGSVTPSTTP